MAGTRVRCVCGTVFDPKTGSVCPSCGAAAKVATKPAAKPATPPVKKSDDASPVPPSPTPTKLNPMLLAGGGAALVIILVLAILAMDGDDTAPASPATPAVTDDGPSTVAAVGTPGKPATTAPTKSPAASPAAVPDGIAAFEGKWRVLTARMQPEAVVPGLPVVPMVLPQTVMAAFLGPGSTATMTVDAGGSYVMDIDVAGEGQYAATLTPETRSKYTAAKGAISFTPRGAALADRTSATLRPFDQDRPHQNAKAGDTELSLLPAGLTAGATASWVRAGGSGQTHESAVGAWVADNVFIDSFLPYRVTLDLRDNGDYRIRFTRTERGLLEAADGKYQFKRAIAAGPPVEGRYTFDGPDRVTYTEPRGTATWVRVKD